MALPDLTGEQRRLYDALCAEPLGLSALSETLGLPVSGLNVLITQLELMGLIEALPGRKFRLTGQ
jgi:DNA-binding IclR family transcriptional regulator